MQKDTQEALEQLEAELLSDELTAQEDTLDDDLDALVEEILNEDDSTFGAAPPGYQNYANGYRAYNSDDSDTDLNTYSDAVYGEAPEKERFTGLLVTIAVLLAGIFAVLLYWAIRYL